MTCLRNSMPLSPQAYKQGMYGSRYVWVLPGPSFLPGWVSKLDYQTLDCTYQEMIEASDWFIMLDYDRFDSRDIITVSGSVSPQRSDSKYLTGNIVRRAHFLSCFKVRNTRDSCATAWYA